MKTEHLKRTKVSPRRTAEYVMTLDRLGSLHQCRLSFMRQLTRRMAQENWRFTRPHFNLDEHSVGYAVYTASYPGGDVSLVVFAHDLPEELRSDRVIAEQWDATFSLFHGIPTLDDIQRLKNNVPKQEAGRIGETELALSRANRSVRLWNYVVETLASGEQPDASELQKVGYLMRTTAVYGSGKFGAADREQLYDEMDPKGVFKRPFAIEMLSVYLIRTFVRDQVNHAARCQGGSTAVTLNPSLAQSIGIGNSTGLGMAPFLINHPVLINNWIVAREEAIARVRSIEQVRSADITIVIGFLERTQQMNSHWTTEHSVQKNKLSALKHDLIVVHEYLDTCDADAPYFWNKFMQWSRHSLSTEAQECMASLMLEPYGHLVDALGDCMDDPVSHTMRIDGIQSVGAVKALIHSSFAWALSIDWSAKKSIARCWYVSEEKLEPRLGERFEEDLEPYEQPLAPARDAVAALNDLTQWNDTTRIADFLLSHPEHRRCVLRAQWHSFAPYGEIRDNTIDADMLPIDLLRAKLSFFGATRFDPRSDRWVRICLYPGAPYPEELSVDNADHWIYSCQ